PTVTLAPRTRAAPVLTLVPLARVPVVWPRALLPCTLTTPALTDSWPENRLLPDRTRVPTPVLVRVRPAALSPRMPLMVTGVRGSSIWSVVLTESEFRPLRVSELLPP